QDVRWNPAFSPCVNTRDQRISEPVSIAAQAVRGAAWNLSTGIGARVLGLVGTLIMTRFIAPDEYGAIAAATITVFTAMNFTDASLGPSIIARRVSPAACFHAFVLHVGLAIAVLVPIVALAPRIGAGLDAPAMAHFVPIFAVASLLERTSHVPSRVLMREMRFRTVALTRGCADLAFTGVSLALAPRIHGYAIPIGNIVRNSILATVYTLAVDRREWFVPQRLRWPIFRDLLAFGVPLSVGGLADYASANWD